MKLDSCYMALALDKAKETVTVASFNLSKEKAEADARERASPDVPILCVDISNVKVMTSQISLWLVDHDIVGAENAEVVRNILKGLKNMLEEKLPAKKRDKRRPR